MSLLQLVYSSRPFGFDDAALYAILTEARRHNAQADITGCLICRPDLYLQWLEGPPDAVEALYARIRRDDRHDAVTRHIHAPADTRLFPDWAMKDDPARSWLWTQAEVADGALGQASEEAFRQVFERVASDAA
ncbi:MAG: BLUF domain-containing protein [Caulobacteraceae bacterium]|nr:BLUF domain-containing protein [Caulobacter sp.]